MNTHNKNMTKKEYARKVLSDPKLVALFNEVINAELEEEHKQTIKFKNTIWGLQKVRELYTSTDQIKKAMAFPSLEVSKLEVADFMEIKTSDLRDLGDGDLIEYTWSLQDDVIKKFTKDII